MNDHAIDSMIYAWLAMKEKEVTMEYINFGKVENVSASVPVAANDTVYHIIIDFVPNCPEIFDSFHTDMGKILECPDDYVLCNISDIVKVQKELDRIRNLSIDSISKALLPFGVNVGLVNPKGPGTFDLDVDIPELDEAKNKIAELEQKLAAAKSNEAYWRNRKEEEEEYHHYWLHTCNRVVKQATQKGVRIGVCGTDDKCNAAVVVVDNMKAEKLEKDLKAANKQLDKMDADIDELKNKNRDLEKELAESKTFAEVEYKWNSDGSFTVTYTKCDGSKQTIGMDLADDTGDKCTMGAFVCRVFNIPQCKNCKNHRYYGKICGHMCYLPDSKCIIPNTFDIFPLTDEEAEGPACDKFEARKEN